MINPLSTILLMLGPGAMLGLLALGLVLIYRGTGVLNFAHGAQATLGGYLYWDLAVQRGLPLPLSLAIAALASGLVGVLIQIVVMRPLRSAAPLARVIATIGVLIIILSSLLLIYGSDSKNVPSLLPAGQVNLGETFGQVGLDRFLLVIVGLLTTAALWFLYKFSTFGTKTAAVAENPVAAATLGHNADRLAMGNWFLGGLLAGFAGAMLAPVTGLDLITMPSLIVPALAAALVGGLVSFPLTMLGGIAILLLQGLATAYIDIRGIGTVSTFIVIVILMVVRGKSIPERGFVGLRLPALGSGRVSWPVVIGWLTFAMVLIWVVQPVDWIDPILTSMVVAPVLLSVVVITGYAGQLSLAQFALAGTGAVIAAEVASRVDLPFLLVIAIAVVGTIPVGIVLAWAAMRMRGTSLAVITLAFNALLYATLFSRSEVINVPSPVIFGLDVSALLYPERYLTVVIIIFTLLALSVAALRRSQTGRRMIASRDNERAAASIGIRTSTAKVVAFAISSAIAAIGGVLIAFRSTAVVYQEFDTVGSINQLAWTVIGGVGFLAGPLLGMGFTDAGLGTQLADVIYSDQFSGLGLIGGIALVLTMIGNQDGMAAVFSKQVDHVRGLLRRGKPVHESADFTPPVFEQRIKPDGRRLSIKGVSVAFGGVKVLKDFSMTVEPGTVHGLIGPNGAGKTTLIDAISGFVKPQEGQISLGDEPLTSLPAWRRAKYGIGRSFQSLELFDDLTVYDNLRAAAESAKPSNVLRDLIWPKKSKLNPAAWDAIRLLRLEDILGSSVRSLSYGQRRLVAIARALATDSEVILLDEPAAGLDEVETLELRAVVRQMAEVQGKAVLLIEHDVEMVMAVSDEVTALNFGTVIAHGTPSEVRDHPDVISSYLGTSTVAEDASASALYPEGSRA
ncbi:ABC transporter permease subunit [Specibacter sp. RAF43]|uniref:ABC transporter permease subunit n=1 Tax=Specibacter sp. RAF43 TaxID=3233057 RepID=UPI003F9919AF